MGEKIPVVSASDSSTLGAAAYCDVDGTLTDTTIVTPLVWIKLRALPPPWNWLWLASLLGRGPRWWVLDHLSRTASNHAIYANYRGISVAQTRALAGDCYRNRIRPKLFAQAVRRLAQFRDDGFSLVLVTGGLDLFMRPMAAELGAECLAPSLAEQDGVFTGQLTSPPFTGEEKARIVRQHAERHGIDLQRSFALGDAIGDLPMLECVGQPIAVNPDSRLAKIAFARGWKVEQWKR